ncbi:MAG: class I SAM-dependent methyltransferase [Candidatus Omnitrophota bacterium]|nr:class I SAM-dependent methyltransferase [Candidatus Omnitrophota bacterium]
MKKLIITVTISILMCQNLAYSSERIVQANGLRPGLSFGNSSDSTEHKAMMFINIAARFIKEANTLEEAEKYLGEEELDSMRSKGIYWDQDIQGNAWVVYEQDGQTKYVLIDRAGNITNANDNRFSSAVFDNEVSKELQIEKLYNLRGKRNDYNIDERPEARLAIRHIFIPEAYGPNSKPAVSLEATSERKILDLATGRGIVPKTLLDEIAKKKNAGENVEFPEKIICLDISSEMLNRAKANLEQYKGKVDIEFLQGSFLEEGKQDIPRLKDLLREKDGALMKFDVIIIANAICFFNEKETEGLLSNALQFLEIGGYLVIVYDTLTEDQERFKRYKPEDYKRVFRELNLEDVRHYIGAVETDEDYEISELETVTNTHIIVAGRRQIRLDDVVKMLKIKNLDDDRIGNLLINTWLKRRKLFLDYPHPDVNIKELDINSSYKRFIEFCQNGCNRNLHFVQSYILRHAIKLYGNVDHEGYQQLIKWMDELKTQFDEKKERTERSGRLFKYHYVDYLTGRAGPHAHVEQIEIEGKGQERKDIGGDSPLEWAAQGGFFWKRIGQERKELLFGTINILGMAVGDLPIIPVDEQGRIREDLIKWMAKEDAIPPAEYYTARHVSLRQLLETKMKVRTLFDGLPRASDI